MRDYGKRERAAFLNPPRSRGVWLCAFAVLLIAAEYAWRLL